MDMLAKTRTVLSLSPSLLPIHTGAYYQHKGFTTTHCARSVRTSTPTSPPSHAKRSANASAAFDAAETTRATFSLSYVADSLICELWRI